MEALLRDIKPPDERGLHNISTDAGTDGSVQDLGAIRVRLGEGGVWGPRSPRPSARNDEPAGSFQITTPDPG